MLGEVVDLAFMFSFGGLRIGVGSYLLYCYFLQDTDFLGRFGGIALYSLSWLFMINILAYGYKKYAKKFRKWQARRQGTDKLKADYTEEIVKNGDSNHNIRSRKIIQNGYVSSKNIQNKLVEQLPEDIIEFSVNRADVITS